MTETELRSPSASKQNDKLLSQESPPETMPTVRECTEVVVRLSLPIVIGTTLNALADTLTYCLVGNLCSSESLGALGLGFMINRMLSQCYLSSLPSGYDTLGTQAFGKGEYRMCGVYMYRAWIIIQIVVFPTYFLVYFSDQVLLLFGVAPRAAELAAVFARSLLLNNIVYFTYDLIYKFLIAQRIAKPQMVINAVASCFHPVWVYIFVRYFKLDYLGAGYALCFTNTLKLISIILYIYFSGACKETLPWPDKGVLVGWGNFLRVAIPSGAMYSLETISYLMVNIFSGRLDKASLAADQSLCNLLIFGFSIPIALGYSACVLTGNSLGSRKPKLAQMYAKFTFVLSVVFVAVYILLVFTFRYHVAAWYSNDADVQSVFVACVPIMLAEVVADSTQGILCRILVAMARQPFASIANLISYFLYMVPLAYVLIYWYGYGIQAIWFTLATAYLFAAMAFGWKIVNEDWEQVSKEAAERVERDRKQLEQARKGSELAAIKVTENERA